MQDEIIAILLIIFSTAGLLDTWFKSDGPLYLVVGLWRLRGKRPDWSVYDLKVQELLSPNEWSRADLDQWLDSITLLGFPAGHILVCKICLSWHIAFWLTLAACFYTNNFHLLLGLIAYRFVATKLA